jgi:hypothetical protein
MSVEDVDPASNPDSKDRSSEELMSFGKVSTAKPHKPLNCWQLRPKHAEGTGRPGGQEIDGMRGGQPAFALAIRLDTRPGDVMLLSLFSAFAVCLTIIVAIVTLVVPFVLGLFD